MRSAGIILVVAAVMLAMLPAANIRLFNAEAQSTTISITTDKSSYTSGDILYYSIEVNPVNPDYGARYEILYPSGSLSSSFEHDPNPEGIFEGADYIEGPSGTWTMVVTYGDATESINFSVVSGGSDNNTTKTIITIATDKSSYVSGEAVSYHGSVNAVGSGSSFKIEIYRPDGTFYQSSTGTLDADGSFAGSASVEGASGVYTITIVYGQETASTTFSISGVPTITLATDKQSYYVGETLHFSGTVSPVINFQWIGVEIQDPDAHDFYTWDDYPSSDGSFGSNTILDGKPGTYALTATYGDSTSSLTFMLSAVDSSSSSSGGTIAFTSDRDGKSEIYVMNADGSDQRNISNNNSDDYRPSWSPDGSKIAYSTWRDGNPEIYVMNADGSGQTRLTNNNEFDDYPSWSPDGKKIAFASNRDGNFEIYVMNADGSDQRNISNNNSDDRRPSWSPDGDKIAFESDRNLQLQVYVMNADGSGQTRLAFDNSSSPSWSPDGKKIAFASNRDGNREIYVMNADGTNQKRLTIHTSFDGDPSWSPDGTKIAFTSNRDGKSEIYVMNADGSVTNSDGSGQTRLTDSAANYQPSWSSKSFKAKYTPESDASSSDCSKCDAQSITITTGRTSYESGDVVTFSIQIGLVVPGSQISIEVFDPNTNSVAKTSLVSSSGQSSYSTSLAVSGVVGTYTAVATYQGDSSSTQFALLSTYSESNTEIPQGSQARDKMTFVSDRSGKYGIYVMNPDGSGQQNLSNEADSYPSWSPDGKKIVFTSYRDLNGEIYVMNADGSGQTRLTNNGSEDRMPSWSPDGTKIVFTSARDDGNGEIYVMNADGSGQTRLTYSNELDDFASWSPDGKKIAFSSTRDGYQHQIYIMNADGSDQRNISNSNTHDTQPSWSPDGKKIAFSSSRDGNQNIYVMNADGTGVKRLVYHDAFDLHPSWSSDCSKIAFSSDRDGVEDVFVVNALDSTALKNLTLDSQSKDFYPSWSPSSKQLKCEFEESSVVIENDDSQLSSESSQQPEAAPSASTEKTLELSSGEQVVLPVESTSSVESFSLDEEQKTVSFQTSGGEDTAKHYTTIVISRLLEGPYVVMVDGMETDSYTIVQDPETGERSITVEHPQGEHGITIKGFKVVPEFPVALAAVAAGIAISIAVTSRKRLWMR